MKCLHLKVYKLSTIEGVERWIVCIPLSVNNENKSVYIYIIYMV
jgi:hypothetical protein